LLPDRIPRRGGRWADHRQVINGVFWRTRSGVPWRDLPAQYGHWKTAYNRHRRWSGDGTWERILDELRRDADATEGAGWTVAVDSGVVRAHQHAAGAPPHAENTCFPRPTPSFPKQVRKPLSGLATRHR
jgi:transposase